MADASQHDPTDEPIAAPGPTPETAGPPAPTTRRPAARWPWIAAIAVALLIAGGAVWWFARPAGRLPWQPPPPPVGPALGLGEAVPLAAARNRVGFRVFVPESADLGPPEEILVSADPPGGQIALVYHPRPGLPAAPAQPVGLLLTESRGTLDRRGLLPGAPAGLRVEETIVNNFPGIWIQPAPARFRFRDTGGQAHDAATRLGGNLLVWEQGGIVFRLETAAPKERALAIAGSLR